ncbi:MAG TPA: DcrB-related protein [Jatrophihabitans sp.]|nr:DcrB-related protein [Jatrophihabitans sp.]
MIRRSWRVLAVLAVIAVLGGCSTVVTGHGTTGQGPTGQGPTGQGPRSGAITSPDGDFSVVLPTGWTDQSDKAGQFGAVTVYIGPVADNFATNINVTREDIGSMSVAEYEQRTFSAVRSQFHASVVSQPASRSVDGADALEYTVDDQQAGKSLRQRQTLVVHDGSGYVITYSALQTAFDASSDDAAAIVDSWQWA